uniref:Uncharacterized protein n=1 Tax=Anopheles dirus TaxID=7168 RepID=A0A182NY65_9DIPT
MAESIALLNDSLDGRLLKLSDDGGGTTGGSLTSCELTLNDPSSLLEFRIALL